MNKLVLYFYSLHKDFALEIENNSQIAQDRYIELISIFLKKKDTKFILETHMQMNSDIRKKYHDYVLQYKNKVPRLNKFNKELANIKDNEYFWIDFNASHTNEETLFIGNLVDVYNEITDDKERAKLFENRCKVENDLFGELLKNYEISIFDSTDKKSIGESDRQKRVCRFCKKSIEDGTTFKLKAHAISEALGNKLLVLNEECDKCNTKFGSKIENDFIQYLDIYRVFFQVIPTPK